MTIDEGELYGLHCDIGRLEMENAKLRKLVKDTRALATDHGVVVRYPYCDAWDERLAVVERQMRELGIEVDEEVDDGTE